MSKKWFSLAAGAALALSGALAHADGEQLFKAKCFMCHGTGAAGAPKIGDKAAWAPRIKTGMDALMNSVMNGKNAMPPKGTCMDCSKEDLQAAVEYLISHSK
ncbi:c-type cytochrome [Thiohalobacter sp. IOR34]|uniref:c-type cytochrome n=1 Tax=Thiohalobacter sp. IOR34 TaxID=3057176 RepID=UPI0025AF184C|nr:c-type cytochrome [Thiohalobacter sp. IOR34]WJW75981.1 c-type cytochrome [Thiohalobacter sp. IOR34]